MLGDADSGLSRREPSGQERSRRPLEIDLDVAGIDEHPGGSILVADPKTPNDESANVNRPRRGLRGSSRACRQVECSVRLPYDRYAGVVDFKRFDGDTPAQDRPRQIDPDRLGRKKWDARTLGYKGDVAGAERQREQVVVESGDGGLHARSRLKPRDTPRAHGRTHGRRMNRHGDERDKRRDCGAENEPPRRHVPRAIAVSMCTTTRILTLARRFRQTGVQGRGEARNDR